ncbi:MAG: Maf family nucleotide pyrophosphatase [Myxococcota bacterium]|nr:Maf family nucleotide pyrophosphatase [Myxococcota bacterium]
MKPVVLASTSQWRRQILADAGVDAEAVDPGVDESLLVGNGPVETAQMRAAAKARAGANLRPDALVIGADQVVHLDGEAIGKPVDEADWYARLASMRGRSHQLTTAVALVDEADEEAFHVTTAVRLRADVSDEEIRQYIRHGEASGCAGGYMVERRGAWLVESVDGDWLNVVGLPVLAVVGRLRARGWRMPQ